MSKEKKRRFAVIFEDGTIGYADEVQALQDGEWKKIAFPEMLRKCHMTITEELMP